MTFDDILQLFVVKEKKFFPLFKKSAENIVKAAEINATLTRTEDQDERKILANRIKECEVEGDTITKTIIKELMDSFVTPFDRDDIHNLAEDMDTFMDNIRDASKKFSIYQPKACSRKITEIADYIKKDADILLEIMKKMENMRKEVETIDKLCDEMKDIEHTVDDVYESYMSTLFSKEQDAIELIKKKNIIQAMEDTSDVAKRVSSTIKSIVVKAG